MARDGTKQILMFRYLGYNGGLAYRRILLWKCVIIGANGEERDSDPDSWHGNPDRKYARRDANEWHDFTEWPVIQMGRLEDRDDPIKVGHEHLEPKSIKVRGEVK